LREKVYFVVEPSSGSPDDFGGVGVVRGPSLYNEIAVALLNDEHTKLGIGEWFIIE
jgi:hypothetical protein